MATATVRQTSTASQLPYLARAFNPAHPDLARSGGVPTKLANEAYVAAMARIVYYWAYAAIDQRGRHGMWEMMKDGPGLMFGMLPGAPKNMTAAVNDFFLAKSPNGRSNIGTVNLDANELKFDADGSLTIHLSAEPPVAADAKANWLPAPPDQFALCARTCVPTQALLDGTCKLPNVERA